MKNIKFTLYALGIAFITLFSACQKDVVVTENVDAETPVVSGSENNSDGRENSGGLQTRACTPVQQPSGFFTGLRYYLNATKTKTLFLSGNTTTTLNWKSGPDTNRIILYFSAAALGGQKASLRDQLRIILSSTSDVQAHHLIPLEFCVPETGSDIHPVVQAAAYNGYHTNESYSAMNINSKDRAKGYHIGSHPNYSAWVVNLLNQYQTRYTPNGTATVNQSGRKLFDNLPACQNANGWIQCKLLPRLKAEIDAALMRAAKPSTANKNFDDYFRPEITPVPTLDQL
jgi:hypothetical protein